jgi:hypothetical protein
MENRRGCPGLPPGLENAAGAAELSPHLHQVAEVNKSEPGTRLSQLIDFIVPRQATIVIFWTFLESLFSRILSLGSRGSSYRNCVVNPVRGVISSEG